MARQTAYEEKPFPVPGLPLEVKLSIQRNQPPTLRLSIYGPKRREHKEPLHAGIINYLLDEVRACVTASGSFPAQGRITPDPYASEEVALDIRYPSPLPAYSSTSLIDTLIRNPIDTAQRRKKNARNSENLFKLLSEKMPSFAAMLADKAKKEQADRERKAHSKPSTAVMDKEREEAYRLFGVTPDTPWEEIKKTYHNKVRQVHPDVKGGADDGSFHTLQEAYELLKKQQQKK